MWDRRWVDLSECLCWILLLKANWISCYQWVCVENSWSTEFYGYLCVMGMSLPLGKSPPSFPFPRFFCFFFVFVFINRRSTFLSFCPPKILLILIVLLNTTIVITCVHNMIIKRRIKKLYMAFHKEKEVPSFSVRRDFFFCNFLKRKIEPA